MKEFKLEPEVIQSNYVDFRNKINVLFPIRAENLNKLYDAFGEERLMFAPASAVNYYHNAFPGGYIDHILRVMKFAAMNYKHYVELGLSVSNFSKKELLFAALNHDLGKMGFPKEGFDGYIINSSDWHVKNQGKVYTENVANPYYQVPDLSLFLLQYYDIKVSWNEYLGIKLHDGIYVEGNKPYYISYKATSKFRTNLIQLLHEADMAATRFEFERWNNTTNILDTATIKLDDIENVSNKNDFDKVFKK